MGEFEDPQWNFTFLAGVDLTLWVRFVALLVLATAIAGVALALSLG